MKHRSSGLKLSDAIDGFLQFKLAEGLSPRTIVSYRHDLAQWLAYAGDQDVSVVEATHLRAFLNFLRTEYHARRFAKEQVGLSPKSVRNFWITLSAFFTWLNREFNVASPMKNVPAPHFTKAEVEPFKQEEVEALLKACDTKRESQTQARRRFTMRRATALRDRAIILLLLDTGLRSSELCALTIGDADLKTGTIVIRHGPTGGAKGAKGGSFMSARQRTVPCGGSW
jgi:integrase/recombinase XerD